MTAFTVNVVPNIGADLTSLLATPSALTGNTAPTGASTFLLVTNTDAATKTVTIACPALVDGRLTTSSSTSPAIAVTSGVGIIPLPDYYKDPATGLAAISFASALTGLKAAVVRVP